MTVAAAHAERMDAIYRYQRHVYDLTRRFYLLGREELLAKLDPPPGGSVLEVGCGTGRNLIVAAQHFPDCSYYGVDISTAMLETARRSIARVHLERQIIVAEGDASAFDPELLFGQAKFDRVIISYSLSMIPSWQRTVARALPLLTERGELHVVDFGQCESLPAWCRSLLFRWLREFDVTPRHDLGLVLRREAEAHHRLLDFAPRFRGYSWIARITPPGAPAAL